MATEMILYFVALGFAAGWCFSQSPDGRLQHFFVALSALIVAVAVGMELYDDAASAETWLSVARSVTYITLGELAALLLFGKSLFAAPGAQS
jgi:uncharacterized membrane protein